MASTRTRLAVALAVALCLDVFHAHTAAAQDQIAHAKDLYASAEYEQALAVLTAVESMAATIEVEHYRALCLLALGRTDDARLVIERMADKDPAFEPSAAQVSPRVQATFREVRRRVLPSMAKQSYAEAKAAFDGGDVERAKGKFERVVAQLDALEALGSVELADLRVLSSGFLDLLNRTAKAAAVPAAAPPEPVARAEPASAPPPVIHAAGESGIVAPVAISQVMPPWTPTRLDRMTYEGILTVVIDETGSVTDVNVTGNLRPNYEASLRRAVGSWRFQPATKDGVPVKYRKNVAIRLAPGQE